MIGDLFAGFNFFGTGNEYPIAGKQSLAIGSAGVIDVARGIPPRTPVQIPAAIDIKNVPIFILQRIAFGHWNKPTAIFNNPSPLGNIRRGK